MSLKNAIHSNLTILFDSNLIQWYSAGYSKVSVIKILPTDHFEVFMIMVFWAKFIPLHAGQLACTIDNVQAHCNNMQIMITTTFRVLLALTTIQFPGHGCFETIYSVLQA